MYTRSPAAISAVLTILLLILLAAVFLLLQMVALNGAGERQGATAIGISLGCQSLVVLVLGALAARATGFLIKAANWNGILAVIVSVLLATLLGGTLSFLSAVISIPLAGIR